MKTDILTNGSTVKKTRLIKNGIRIQCIRSDRGSWLVIEFFLPLSFFNINDTFKTGD